MTTTRPFAQFPTTMLISVVKRNKYARFGAKFGAELNAELAIRRMEEKRSN